MMIDSDQLRNAIERARQESQEYLKANPLANIDAEYARRSVLEWMLREITYLEGKAQRTVRESTTTKNLLCALRNELREAIQLIDDNVESEDDSE